MRTNTDELLLSLFSPIVAALDELPDDDLNALLEWMPNRVEVRSRPMALAIACLHSLKSCAKVALAARSFTTDPIDALVAQRKEYQPPKLTVAGSNPAKGTNYRSTS